MGEYLPAKGYETLGVYRCGPAVKLELSRPERMNAFDNQLRLDLLEAAEWVASDDEVRAVLLTGVGRAFSSGADLREDRDRTPEGHRDVYSVLTGHYHKIITGLRPGAGWRVSVLSARVHQHRAGSRRRLVAACAQQGGFRARG